MMSQRSFNISWVFIFIISFILACRPGVDTSSGFSVNVRFPSEPENLHPMLSRSSYGGQVTGFILLPPAEFDPITLQLSPLLITEIPEAEDVIEGPHAGGKVFKMQFRPEAAWDNGTPVTAIDYLFTIKAAYNPHVNSGWKIFLPFLSEVLVDETDPKKVTVYVDSSYILALEAVVNFNIYPEHVYDPDHIMAGFTLDELRDADKEWTPAQDSLLKKFADAFQSTQFLREKVEGSGPYKFDSWVTGEYISISRKENWWGDNIQNSPLMLHAHPSSITYRIITDAASAEAALKSGEIDVMSEIPPASFLEMKNNPEWKDKFHFESPELLQIYYLDINNRDPILSDPRIRKALAHSIDYDGIMKNLLVGLGKRATGPIHPTRSYYNNGIKPIEQDINRSISLIKEAGWEDTNGNGIPDKIINGKREELRVDMTITNKEEGQIMAAIVRENAKKAGIDVAIKIVETSQFNQDLRQFNFDLIPVRPRSLVSGDDPYQSWHSDSDQPGGSNRSGFQNDDADDAIEKIRTAETIAERDSSYHKLQEILYEEQPAIFLYVPLERIMVSKKFEIISSSRKPGYFENLFKLAG